MKYVSSTTKKKQFYSQFTVKCSGIIIYLDFSFHGQIIEIRAILMQRKKGSVKLTRNIHLLKLIAEYQQGIKTKILPTAIR